MRPEEDLRKSAEILSEIKALEGRDVQLWSIAILVVLLSAGFVVALGLPNLWDVGILSVDGRFVPQLVFGFLLLIVLFNIYALRQRRLVQGSRQELVRQLLRADAAERLSMTDPLTGLFNRRYMDVMLGAEAKRSSRTGSDLSLLLLDLDGFGAVNKQIGHLEGDQVLIEFGKLLVSVFRQSDTVVRFGGDEFVVILPDTDAAQANRARERLLERVEAWNRDSPVEGYQLRFTSGISTLAKDEKVDELLVRADEELLARKAKRGFGE